MASDAYLTELITFFEGPEHLDWYGCICTFAAYWELLDNGQVDVGLRLHEDKTAEEALEMAVALRDASDAILKQGGTELGARYIRAVALWYEIVGNLGCGAKAIDNLRKRWSNVSNSSNP